MARPTKPKAAAQKPAKAKRGLPRLRLLPLTIFVAVLMLGAKVTDLWYSVTAGAALPSPSAVAEGGAVQSLPLDRPAAPVEGAPTQVAESKPAEHAAPPAPATPPAPAAQAPAPAAPAGGSQPSAAGQTFSPTELELLQRLQERREQLDQRGRELDQREAMLAAAEQRFDQKIAELQKLRGEIQGLLRQVSEEQATQLDSLVKIYEAMKPADAAKIFNDLDNTVLLNVISRMKEGKTAPILAAMESKRAQQVTILLAERKKLPAVPE
ncbi:MotE family protein [Aerophototrophica crusticola]